MANKTNTGALPEAGESLLTMKDVCKLTTWSRTSINRKIREGDFPAPIKLGAHRIAFIDSEVRAYVAHRTMHRTHEEIAREDRAIAEPNDEHSANCTQPHDAHLDT